MTFFHLMFLDFEAFFFNFDSVDLSKDSSVFKTID